MFRKILPLILMLVLLFLPGKVQAGKDYVAERFDVDIILNTDGSMQVTETIAFRFMGGPFSYVYRDLEKTRTDGITFTSAELDGRPLTVNGENAIEWVEVKEGDPLSVKWHFAPTTDQIRIYTLTYQVSGIVRKGDMDSIVWMAIPPEHEYRSQTSRITVAYPDGAIPAGQPLLEGSASYMVENDGNPFVLTSGPVEVDTPLVMTLNFNAGTLSKSVPAWFHALNAQDAEAAFGAFASFMTSSSSDTSSGGGGGGGASGGGGSGAG
jgi:uncharacterized membrane protein YgcG